MRLFVLIPILMLVGCSKGKKNDYTSEIYYEQTHTRDWYTLGITKSPKYTEVTVAVPIKDRVEPAFLVERMLYEKEGEKYKEAKIKTVNLEVYEAADKRRQKILTNLFNAFRLMILIGGLGVLAGVLLFALKFKFPAIPSIWDEFLIYGGVVICIGMFGAWYVEQFITVCICGGVAIVVFAGYSLVKHTKREKKHAETAMAVDDIVATVEVLKLELGDKWNDVKGKLEQDPRTKSIVESLKASAKEKAKALTSATG